MKILISAYSCEPGKGSEPGVGWNIAREVAKYHQVWVLTRPDESKKAIEAELAKNPVPNLKFVYFTLPFWQDSMRWGQSGAMQIHYYLWQIQAYFVARRLHQQIGFDVIHHVTFVKYSSPSFLSLLPVPFIWGSVGGGESAPKAFWQDFSFKAKVYEIARSIVRGMGELDPFVKITAKKSAVVKATTKDTAARIYKMGVDNVQISSESGLSAQEIAKLAQYELPNNFPIRFISMGRLLHWKGFYLGVQAFAKANLHDAEYWIVGDGAEWEHLHKLVSDLGITNQVKFWGRLPREATLDKLGQCHVLVHPSLHDSGGWVCLEGMAVGRPIICLDLGGPAVQVTPETGFKIRAIDPNQVVRDLAKAMTCLAENPSIRIKMGETGRQLVKKNYSWEVKGKNLDRLYTEIANHNNSKYY